MNIDQLLSEQSRSLRQIEKEICCLITAINNVGVTAEGRVYTIATTATLTPDVTPYDMFIVTDQATAIDIANPIGGLIQGLAIIIRIKDNGVSRAITYGSQYRAIGAALPTATTAGKTLYLGMIWNATDTTFDVFPYNEEI